MVKYFFFILSFLIFCCCQENKKEIHPPSFYYWKQEFSLNTNQKKLLKELGSKELYVKFFDVKMINGRPEPVAKIDFKISASDYSIIPCVFITNDVFSSDQVNPEKLASRTVKLILSIAEKNKLSFKEVQFDCDWTMGSKENYFRFLKKANEQLSNKKLSATIRLHQYKYWKKTGVPPVDRGVLMCYNMGEIENINESNSIFSYHLVTQYLKKGMTYPLKSSVALPIYKWALVYRLGQLSSILNNVDKSSMQSHIVSATNNRFLVKDNFYINGQFLSMDDEIRFEEVDLKELEQTAKLLSSLNFDKLIYYHLSQSNIEDYDKQQLDQINTLIYK